MWEWLRDASAVEKTANAFLLVCTGLGVVFGLRRGKQRASAPPPDRIEVAGAVVSDDQARKIVASLDANTRALNHNTDIAREMADDIRDVGRDMREISRNKRE